jgi:uncharacterized protein
MVGGESLGSIEDISLEELWVDIKKRKDTAELHPAAAFTHEHIRTDKLEDSLLRLAEFVRDNGMGGTGEYKAARDLLLRNAPALAGGEPLHREGEAVLDAAVRASTKLDDCTLPIQGPPGAGKTYTGARMICELVQAGQRVGIVANSHAVIRNLLDGVAEQARYLGLDLQCVQKPDDSLQPADRIRLVSSADAVFDALNLDCQVAAGTCWLWAAAPRESVDVLFVDEAAQMSLANVLAVAPAARSLVLLGDPQQLDQPMKGSHPDGTDCSALDHILGGQKTIPSDRGLFLSETWRLHPEICTFTSELFYEDKLRPRASLVAQRVQTGGLSNATGLIFSPVEHQGNQNCSPEEATVVACLVEDILAEGARWTNSDGEEQPLTLADILIITPYNAQVHEIHKRLPAARVGTVDKFQGQEAPIAIYSLASSSYADAPRGMEFLYSLNRLNVATSRARCVSILVGSPALFSPDCKNPRQMQLANAFCRYLELAHVQPLLTGPVLSAV